MTQKINSDYQAMTVVVIGNGMVGNHFIEGLIEATEGKSGICIHTFSAEPRCAYDRVHLSEYFATRDASQLALATEERYRSWGVNLHLGDPVVNIDRQRKLVRSRSGLEISYDKLVLATGSNPFVPPVEGNDRPNCFVYRTIEDLEKIIAAAHSGAKVGTVVGGGLLGLEAAKALHDLGLQTHVVEFAPRLMALQIDTDGGALLKDKIESIGVKVHLSKATQQIEAGEKNLQRMVFADDSYLETDIIVFSAGIRPADQLARNCGLEVGERGGVVIGDTCQTSDPDIYAIGECALWKGRIFGLVAPGYSMARVVVSQLLGQGSLFQGADMSTKLKLLGTDVASIGDAHANTPGALNYTYFNQPAGYYKKLVISSDKKTLLGAVLVGDTSEYAALLQYKINAIGLPQNPESLILPSTEAKPALGVEALPATAQICSCHDVSKGDIATAVTAGCCSVGEVKSETKAGTGCGGCSQLLTTVVNHNLQALGIEVNRNLCEHFDFTRQELHHLIRVEKILSFSELLLKHGRGHGCAVCKPTVGSILASLWNEYILDQKHIGLQDTNDIFLGNMQKDGSYSVVPRVAGGEITPDKLIVLGEIARDFNLYTKITGGQRIDLFGAQLHELPLIWRRLVDAGFETGHAYGKSVRTVKSCVGSTWCRFGVDDSVGLAIDIENRYKGLRAPHKIKFAVSGCTRECAEAQSKDFGIIATEKGWNLYVCGNGGMKPRHADLFATDLDRNTLIRYLDRLLMFYSRTADRLQRTSVWMENMEGGIEYLRKVIIEDSLGIAAELEAEMAYNIGNYQCEWNTTLNDPQKLKRFSHFINSDATDGNLLYVSERGQRRPATADEKEYLIAKENKLDKKPNSQIITKKELTLCSG
ncbi:Nitrite reductase [NAD(P)H] [Microbulbifer aestuariivivens]|uniref:Nitrite reductase [NAD(P)H] n=1 Tax=Microbulbifer aestuariivivens TaxID=1908308 RepID=A0ABP9WVE8_9GAMM